MSKIKTLAPSPALQAALASAPQVAKIYAVMPASHQREYNRWISSAKKTATQTSRAKKALTMIVAWNKNKKP